MRLMRRHVEMTDAEREIDRIVIFQRPGKKRQVEEKKQDRQDLGGAECALHARRCADPIARRSG